MSAKIRLNQLQDGLRTKRFGRKILFYHKTGSTNDWAKELARCGTREGTVVIAETQTNGRGRLDRKWVSPIGGLWFSLILRLELHPSEALKLTFVAGLAVAKVLHDMFDLRVETKWPNDVLVKGRKICGILTEMNTTGETVNFVVVGVGVNTNFDVEKTFQEPLKRTATSLENELGRKVRLEELFKSLLEELENLYDHFTKEGFDSILKEWKSYASFLGHQVEITGPAGKLSGLALDVNNDGVLILKLEDGRMRHVFVGDISLQVQ
ncbi:MAG: biotin--[acetyl-CoA-carboxylase] ligase [Candidatus Bathyarchaeota archaeon]|nr:MAG: biotin--[acetyl-CoA-carboxylase] ligase [Candidatus Bathyarchaeota archaeon]